MPPKPQTIEPAPGVEVSAADLIAEYNKITAHLDSQNKQFAEYSKPYRDRVDAIRNQLLAMLIARKEESVRTDAGTAYLSTIVTPKLNDRMTFLDWCLEDWDNRGDMLQIGAPQKAALDAYQDALRQRIQEGALPDDTSLLPPGVETSSFTRANIRKS